MKPLLLFLGLNLILNLSGETQENASLATGIGVLRNLSPMQGFWAVGQTIQAQVHFSPAHSAYAWVEYYTEGTFRNNFPASAKTASVSPAQINFRATGRLAYRQLSLGWKRYLRGGYAEEQAVSVYATAGFGFLFARVRNAFSTGVDTSKYAVPTLPGEGTVRKLTFDAGAGAELPLSGSVYAFADLRTWLPASSKTSSLLHSQKNVPLPVMLTAGVRVLLLSRY